MIEWSFDVIPICSARPVAETGASITGGAAQVGRVALTSGPPVGAEVVTVGAAELVGVETGIDGEE